MILTSTYRDQTTLSRDLLAAFSPLDHPTTATLTAQELKDAFERLIRRLAVLVCLHGAGAAGAFLAALADPGADADVVDVAAAFLEHGAGEAAAGPSEIQQELVHFSRIVDIGHLGLSTGVDEHALRRLRGSTRLPDSLKVLSELLVVTRARLAQRGLLLPAPWLRPPRLPRPTRRQISRQQPRRAAPTTGWPCAVAAAGSAASSATSCRPCWPTSPRPRPHSPCGHTPGSSSCPTCAARRGPGRRLPRDHRRAVELSARYLPGRRRRHRPRRAPLPAISQLLPGDRPIDMGEASYRVHAGSDRSATVTETQTGRPHSAHRGLKRPRTLACGPRRARLRAARVLCRPRPGQHGSRAHPPGPRLDIDQDTGTVIGAALLPVLAARQGRPPLLTPMMDDDHVLVRLAPATYRAFLAARSAPRPCT